LGERESVSWHEELDLAQAYLDVEQVRFGARLNVEVHLDEACAECQVPPLVLQPLIENAVKHGIATMVEGGTIRVESKVVRGFLEVSVENAFDPESPSPRRNGLGLRNVRSRLERRFGP
jgi:sensor histidine kinase YesM